MKKLLFFGCCFLLVLSGCQKQSNLSSKHVIQLSAQEVNKKIRHSTSPFLLYLTTDECYSCNEYDKVLKKLQKQSSFTIYYVVVDDEDEEAMRELNMSIGSYETLPMTYYIKDGSIQKQDRLAGFIEKDEYLKWLQKREIVK